MQTAPDARRNAIVGRPTDRARGDRRPPRAPARTRRRSCRPETRRAPLRPRGSAPCARRSSSVARVRSAAARDRGRRDDRRAPDAPSPRTPRALAPRQRPAPGHPVEEIVERRIERAGHPRRASGAAGRARDAQAERGRGEWHRRLSSSAARRTSCGEPGRPPPFVEHVEDVGVAEIDPHRTPPRTLRVVALEIAIDARESRP